MLEYPDSKDERGVDVARRRGLACRTRSPPSSAAYEPYSLTTLVSSAGQSSSATAREPPCRPGRSALDMQRAPNYDVVSGARCRRPWWAERPSVACRAAAGARASTAAAGCARTHSAPSGTRARRRARWLSVSPAPAAACVLLGAPRSTRRPRRRLDGRVSFTSRTAIDTLDVPSFAP